MAIRVSILHLVLSISPTDVVATPFAGAAAALAQFADTAVINAMQLIVSHRIVRQFPVRQKGTAMICCLFNGLLKNVKNNKERKTC